MYDYLKSDKSDDIPATTSEDGLSHWQVFMPETPVLDLESVAESTSARISEHAFLLSDDGTVIRAFDRLNMQCSSTMAAFQSDGTNEKGTTSLHLVTFKETIKDRRTTEEGLKDPGFALRT